MNKERDLADSLARASAAEERLRSQTLLRAEAEHRMKTSLAVISGWASTIDDRWDQLPEVNRRDGVGIIRRASDELTAQMRRLLEDARAEMLGLDLEPVRLDLCAVLNLTTTTFRGLSDGHLIEHASAHEAVFAEVDPAALQQVLGHLIENAVKYSAPGTKVVARALLEPEAAAAAVIEVADEGIGIPDDVDIFAPFVRGTGTTGVGGVGLGLYIVRNLARAMGGDVTARRNAGPGSTFALRLRAAG